MKNVKLLSLEYSVWENRKKLQAEWNRFQRFNNFLIALLAALMLVIWLLALLVTSPFKNDSRDLPPDFPAPYIGLF